MSEGDTTINVKGLDQLLKALKGKLPTARVGILGDKNVRNAGKQGKTPSNATIGAYHEFGTSKLPVRSFLRLPISAMLQKRMNSSGLLDKDALKDVITSGSVVPWLKKVAILAEGIVADAFSSGGFGTWKPSDMSHKQNHQTLVETQQVRNSITSEVKE